MLAEIDLSRLPERPKIDEAGYAWTGRFGQFPSLIVGHTELEFDKQARRSVLDTRKWLQRNFSEPQLRRSRKFHQLAPSAGEHVLIYVYEDIGTAVNSLGNHQAKRGRKRFTGIFLVEEREDNWLRAKLIRRDNLG
ncbi:hypothetical protein GE300_15770 [Rhodobacteraceae bacterium 2CG4]|uniref:Uncharacterized protein n=1 Tax=Halovulum marinum TaxID=2662447 RepID=A0A6L5Z3E0_9RHOB|nr:hypothetical protein [Halovulum marinum]MSU91047.1 hypothetical protein [Halovulum marinum]